ncbi:MAG: PAS domain S-box-containing protein, partial [Reinekea sp.]
MPEDDGQSLYQSAFANSDSLAILCSNDGSIQAVSNILAQQIAINSNSLIGQPFLVANDDTEPSLDWLTTATHHQKEWLVQGDISVLGCTSCFKNFASFYVKKLFNDNQVVGYQLKLAPENALEATLPQRGWLQLFNDSSDGVILFNESMNILSTNKAFNRLTGLSTFQPGFLSIDEVLQVSGPFSRWLTDTKKLTTTGILKSTLGEQTNVSISVTPFDIGNQLFFWCFISDLTHATQLQQKLNATLSHFKALFDNNRDGIALANLQGTYIEINEQFAKILGYERDQVIGRHFAHFNARNSFELPPEQVNHFIETGFAEPFEKKLQRADGTTISVSVQLFPHYSEKDEYNGAWSIVHPISAQEKQYRRQKKRFDLLLERSIDAIAYSNFSGTFEVANKAFCDMVGRSAEELVGMNYKELTPQEDIHREESVFRDQLLTRGYSDVYAKNFISSAGEMVPVSIRTVLIRSESGEPEGVWSISRDNKLRDRLVDSLAESEHRFRSLFSNSFDAIALWSPNDEIQYANKAYLE